MLGPVRRKVSPHARRLRRQMTAAESRLWAAVRDRRLGGYKFRFQHSVLPYIADFACLEAMVIVEIDGSQHGPEQDAVRTAELERRGYKLLRFWNNDLTDNMPSVLETVLMTCRQRSGR